MARLALLAAAFAAGAHGALRAGERRPERAPDGLFVTNAEEVKVFQWSNTTRSAREALELTFPKEAGWPNIRFHEATGGLNSPKMTRERVADWVENQLLGGHDPFDVDRTGGVPVPWPKQEGLGDQLGNGQYVGYSRRQLCFIVAKSLLGATTIGYDNGLARILSKQVPYCPNCVPAVQRNLSELAATEPSALTGNFGMNLWLFLTSCAADPTLEGGKQGPMLLVAKGAGPVNVSEVKKQAQDAPLAGSGLAICRYDDGDAGPMEDPALRTIGPELCTPPSYNAPGHDFMAGGRDRVRGQAIQDITAKFVGGYVFGYSCGLGGGQDERLMTYLPEVFALTFFLSQAKGEPQLREPSWILGARIFLVGLDGSARFNTRLEPDPAVPMTSDLVDVEVDGRKFRISNSAPFLGFMTETQDFLEESKYFTQNLTYDQIQQELFSARRNANLKQRAVDEGTWYSFMYQVRAWYSAVALTSYSASVQPALRTIVKSLGVGPWLAGLWWGDSQLGFLAVWIGQAIASRTWPGGLPLEYYIYSDFTENPGNQCFVHSKEACVRCLHRCAADPLPQTSYWLPDYAYMLGKDERWQPCVVDSDSYCGEKGLEDALRAYSSWGAGRLWDTVEAAFASQRYANVTVFDTLLQ